MLGQRLNADAGSFFEKIRSIDYLLIIIILILGIISSFAMYSTDGGEFLYHTKSHILRFGIFFVLFLVLSFVQTKVWHRIGYIFYLVTLFMLFWALYFGVTASGSQRWISLYVFNLQPSELMKIAIIISFAKFYHRTKSTEVNRIKNVVQPLVALTIPIFLVIAQPDLGTAILIAGTGISVMWLSGLKLKYFVYSFLILMVTAPFAISLLKPYQKLRVLTFFNPDRDPLGAGYQIIQSKIAVGSGGLAGKGFLKGTQGYLEFLPEKHTDFIFTLFSEEFGFVGSIFLLILYVILIYRIILIGFKNRNYFGKLYCFGFASAIFIYVMVNMSMVLGILPIVGSPLPIMSYGGSSMLATMMGLSIVMGCKIYAKELIA
jgi:rod shape determining protein RodA